MDIGYKIIFEIDNFKCNLGHALMCSFSMIFAILLFPYSNYVKDEKKIIISGISVSRGNLTYRNFEGLFKMFGKGAVTKGEFDKVEKICIIPSTDLKNTTILIEDDLKSDTVEEDRSIAVTDQTRNELAKLHQTDDNFKKHVDDYNLFIEKHTKENIEVNLQEQQQRLGEILGLYFRKTRETGKKEIEIEFLPPVDYDIEYKEMIDKIHNSLEKLSQTTNTDNAYIYVSLGTSLLTSALTIMAIKGNREIMYLDQKTQKDIKTYTPEIVTLSKYLDEKTEPNNQ